MEAVEGTFRMSDCGTSPARFMLRVCAKAAYMVNKNRPWNFHSSIRLSLGPRNPVSGSLQLKSIHTP